MSVARPDAHEPRPDAVGSRVDQGLPSARRIRRSLEIRGLLKRGKRKRTAHLDVFFGTSPASFPRLGVLVPRHRHTVVERNRLKRRLRELGRTRLLPVLRGAGLGTDVVVRARWEAYGASFAELKAELDEVLGGLCSESRSSL